MVETKTTQGQGIQPAVDTGFAELSVRGRGTDFEALGIGHANSLTNTYTAPLVTEASLGAQRWTGTQSLANSRDGVTPNFGPERDIGNNAIGHMQGPGFARSQSIPAEPYKFETDLHDPAHAPRGIVHNVRNGVVIGSFVGTPVKFGNN